MRAFVISGPSRAAVVGVDDIGSVLTGSESPPQTRCGDGPKVQIALR